MRNTKHAYLALFIASLACVLTACTTPPQAIEPAPAKTVAQQRTAVGTDDQRRIKDNCLFGIPVKEVSSKLGSTRYIYRDGYVLEHSDQDKIPLWVSEHITRAEVTGPLTRPKPEPFAPDPKLKDLPRAELKDYVKSGYDRGHQAPSGNQTVDKRLQAETYYLSNMAPQTPALNQRIWQKLEDTIREWAKNKGEVWTITGPLFCNSETDSARKPDVAVPHDFIGQGKVAVPTYFYKIAVAKNGQGQWQAIAFVMKNQKQEFPKPYVFKQYIKSIDWIEDRTGLNFMPELDASSEEQLERRPASPAAWGLND